MGFRKHSEGRGMLSVMMKLPRPTVISHSNSFFFSAEFVWPNNGRKCLLAGCDHFSWHFFYDGWLRKVTSKFSHRLAPNDDLAAMFLRT
jgi:hypothetical protein